MIRSKHLWRWGFVALVAACTVTLFALYMSAVLDKQVGPAGKIALLAIAGVGIIATFLATGGVFERGRGLAGLATPKSASLAFGGVIIVFGLMTDVYGFIQPRPAVESEMGKIERTTDAILGAVTVEGRATPEETAAWEALPPGDCDALRTHVERFPAGAYAPQAAARLAARRTVETEVWTPVSRPLPPRTVDPGNPESTEAAARAAALARGQDEAKLLCNGFAATSLYRLRDATLTPTAWTCTRTSAGHACGFKAEAACNLDMRGVETRETCEVGR